MTDLPRLLAVLVDEKVEFVLIGGVAAVAHGSSRLTQDVDIVYSRKTENLARIVKALTPFRPYLRGVPEGLPFLWDIETLRRGFNFTLTTVLGPIDLLGEIPGGGGYEQLLPGTSTLDAFGVSCPCLSLSQLIQAKRAAGRTKDLEAIAELETILAERGRR